MPQLIKTFTNGVIPCYTAEGVAMLICHVIRSKWPSRRTAILPWEPATNLAISVD